MRKESWEVNKAGEASELEPLSLDTITEAIEPGEEIEWGTPTLKSTDKGESLPRANSSPSYPPGYSTTEEHPVMIQQVVGAKEMGETFRKSEEAAVEYLKEQNPTGPKVSMSCTHVLCTYKTNYLTKKVAINRQLQLQSSTQETPKGFQQQP